jgi:hypothetical protein
MNARIAGSLPMLEICGRIAEIGLHAYRDDRAGIARI